MYVFRRRGGCWWAHPLWSLPNTRVSAGRRPKSLKSQLHVICGGRGGEAGHTVSGWETPRGGGAWEAEGPHCKVRRSHQRVGRYKRAFPAPGVVPVWSRVVLAPRTYRRSNFSDFQFTDAIISTVFSRVCLGDSAPPQACVFHMLLHTRYHEFPGKVWPAV